MQMAARHGVQKLGYYYVDIINMVLILSGKIKGSGISGFSCLNSFKDCKIAIYKNGMIM